MTCLLEAFQESSLLGRTGMSHLLGGALNGFTWSQFPVRRQPGHPPFRLKLWRQSKTEPLFDRKVQFWKEGFQMPLNGRFSCLHTSQGLNSLQNVIFLVSRYLLSWPLLFSRAFHSPPPPIGFHGYWRRQETSHGFLQLCTCCHFVQEEAGNWQTGIRSAEIPPPTESTAGYAPRPAAYFSKRSVSG